MSFMNVDATKAKANLLKEDGNKCFQNGDYKGAEGFYSQAIQKDSLNAKFFTNRAMARLKLEAWEGVIDDCIRAIELEKTNNMKGYYYLAQAQLALRHPNEAHASALTAYEECIRTSSSSTGSVSALVLQAKKEKWEAREKDRIRQRSDLLQELENGLGKVAAWEKRDIETRVKQGEISQSEGAEETQEVEESSRRKIQELQSVFAISDPANLQRREVPDYLIDNISFAIMHDPVVTKTGQSYDRSTLIEHLRRSPTDPLTRESLRIEECRTNIALKAACEQFLEENGWAVDW